VTGRRSYTTLERIGDLQRIAADESLDETLRSRATHELALIHNGGSVESAHRRMKAQLAVSELQLPTDDDPEPADMPQASSIGEALVHAAELTTPEIELEQLARDALARAKEAPKSGSIRPATCTDIKLPVRSFVFLWNDLREWWLRYDLSEISSALTDEQWNQIEATLAGTIAFLERLRSLRVDSHKAVREWVTSAPFS
jgi:ParB family chromosome partitioning protein